MLPAAQGFEVPPFGIVGQYGITLVDERSNLFYRHGAVFAHQIGYLLAQCGVGRVHGQHRTSYLQCAGGVVHVVLLKVEHRLIDLLLIGILLAQFAEHSAYVCRGVARALLAVRYVVDLALQRYIGVIQQLVQQFTCLGCVAFGGSLAVGVLLTNGAYAAVVRVALEVVVQYAERLGALACFAQNIETCDNRLLGGFAGEFVNRVA